MAIVLAMEAFTVSDFRFTRRNKMDTTIEDCRQANVEELRVIVGSLLRKGEAKKNAWWRIGNILGITPRQVKRLYYSAWHDPPGSLLEFVRIRVDQHHALQLRDDRKALIRLLERIDGVKDRLDANPNVDVAEDPPSGGGGLHMDG